MQCIVVRAPSTTWQRIWNQELGWESPRFLSYQFVFSLQLSSPSSSVDHLHPNIILVLVIIIQGAQVMHLVLGVIFPLAPLFLLRGQAREKSGIEVRLLARAKPVANINDLVEACDHDQDNDNDIF